MVLVLRPRASSAAAPHEPATPAKPLALHLGVIALLLALHFILPPYHHTNLARVMVLAVFAMGYNITFGYTGMLSLGHALFFASGLYATGLLIEHGAWTAGPGLVAGVLAGGAMALAVGLLALRTTGVAFMIVTLMFAQAGYLAILYFGILDARRRGLRASTAPPAPSARSTSATTRPAISRRWRSSPSPC